MRPWLVGVCTRTSWGYAPMLHGATYPYGADLCTHKAWAYAPMLYGSTHPLFYGVTASGFAQRPVFTALRGFPPPEAFVLTST